MSMNLEQAMMVASTVVVGEVQPALLAMMAEEGYLGAAGFGTETGAAVSALFRESRTAGEAELEGKDEDARNHAFMQSLMTVFMASSDAEEVPEDAEVVLAASRRFLNIALASAPEMDILGVTSALAFLPVLRSLEGAGGVSEVEPLEAKAKMFFAAYVTAFGELPEGSQEIVGGLRDQLGEMMRPVKAVPADSGGFPE